MAAGVGLQLAINNYTLNVCKALRDCELPKHVEELLRNLLLFVSLSTDQTEIDSNSDTTAPAGPLAVSYERVLTEAQIAGNTAHVLAGCLFLQLETITFSLFPGTGNSHPGCTPQLFYLQHPVCILAAMQNPMPNTWHECMLPCLQGQQLQPLRAKLFSVCSKVSSKQRLQLLVCKP